MTKKILIKNIVLISVLIYFIFLSIDIITKNTASIHSSYLKYTAICLCFTLTLLINHHGYNNKDTLLLQMAFFFTLIADFFLVILNWPTPGVFTFIFVQTMHKLRHLVKYRLSKKNIFIFLVINLILLLFFPLLPHGTIPFHLYLISVFYGSLLSINLIDSIKTLNGKANSKENSLFIALGMFLFFMCDINVALFNIIDNNITGFFIWLFYFPSQLFLSLSGYDITYLKNILR